MASLILYMSYMEISVCIEFVYFLNAKITYSICASIFEICIIRHIVQHLHSIKIYIHNLKSYQDYTILPHIPMEFLLIHLKFLSFIYLLYLYHL